MKRSLHIGINDYPGTGSDLSGCVNDANDWKETLEARGFQTTSLLDSEASKSNMVEAKKNNGGRCQFIQIVGRGEVLR